jgi:hypothetical protein
MGTILFTLLYLTLTQNLKISQQFAYLTNKKEVAVSCDIVTLILNIFRLVHKIAEKHLLPSSNVSVHRMQQIPLDGYS